MSDGRGRPIGMELREEAPPCDTCLMRTYCAKEQVACRDFADFLNYGLNLVPARVLAYRRRNHTLPYRREPSRKIFDRLNHEPRSKLT